MILLFFPNERNSWRIPLKEQVRRTWTKPEKGKSRKIEWDSFFLRERKQIFQIVSKLSSSFDTPDDDAEWFSRDGFIPRWDRQSGKDTRGQVFWEYFGGPRLSRPKDLWASDGSGSTVSYIRVNYSDDINIGAPFCSLRTERVLSPPSSGVFYTSRLDKRRYWEICFRKVSCPRITMENSVLKVIIEIIYLFNYAFWRLRVLIFLEINDILFMLLN